MKVGIERCFILLLSLRPVVRRASVTSLSRLASDRASLAAAAVDHLSDMFNDEIEQVRLDAVRALLPLIRHGTLTLDQIDVVLNVLNVRTSSLVVSIIRVTV